MPRVIQLPLSGWKGSRTYVRRCVLPEVLALRVIELFETSIVVPHNRKWKKAVPHKAIKLVAALHWNFIKEEKPDYEYYELSSDYIIKVLGSRDYFWIKSSLVEFDVLEEYPSCTRYEEGRSIAYRFNQGLIDSEPSIVEYIDTKNWVPSEAERHGFYQYVDDVLRGLTFIQTSTDIIDGQVLPEEVAAIMMERVRFDDEGNLWYKSKNKFKFIDYLAKGFATHDEWLHWKLQSLVRTYQRVYLELFMLADTDEARSSSRPKVNNRLFHLISRTPGLLLRNLVLDGEPIYEVDLRNSQFALLSSLLRALSGIEIRTAKPEWRKLLQQLYDFSSSPIYQGLFRLEGREEGREEGRGAERGPIMFTELGELMQREDIQRFIRQCSSGRMYDEVCTTIHGAVTEELRDQVKGAVMKILFGYYNSPLSDTESLIKGKYPNVVSFIGGFKRYMETVYSQTSDPDLRWLRERTKRDANGNIGRMNFISGNNHLSIMLQRVESEIFVDDILGELCSQGYRVLTKHDSILVKESELSEVRELVHLRLSLYLGEDGFRLGESDRITCQEFGSIQVAHP